MLLLGAYSRLAGVMKSESIPAVGTALAALERGEEYDVVLMDIQMSGMDGLKVTRELRNRGFEGPIITLPANTKGHNREV